MLVRKSTKCALVGTPLKNVIYFTFLIFVYICKGKEEKRFQLRPISGPILLLIPSVFYQMMAYLNCSSSKSYCSSLGWQSYSAVGDKKACKQNRGELGEGEGARDCICPNKINVLVH